MASETPTLAPSLLIPDRHPQKSLFVCDISDAFLKDLIQDMEHPFYSLSKKPNKNIRRYEHNGTWIEIIPSVKGQATIYDKDILIYCISQIMGKLKNGQRIETPFIRINSIDFLKFTNRGLAGKDYIALSDALDRLAGTRIVTNISTGKQQSRFNFGLIDVSSLQRTDGLSGRLLCCEIKLSDWVFRAIRANEVLTLHPDYFRLRKPLERRLYELARKHCGTQKKWLVSWSTLLKKTGSQGPLKRFKHSVRAIAEKNHLPDYWVEINGEKGELVCFVGRNPTKLKNTRKIGRKHLLTERIIQRAKKAAPGYDIYSLHEEWKAYWNETGTPELKNPDAAFIGFCKKRCESMPLHLMHLPPDKKI